jgi:hypothetical protein
MDRQERPQEEDRHALDEEQRHESDPGRRGQPFVRKCPWLPNLALHAHSEAIVPKQPLKIDDCVAGSASAVGRAPNSNRKFCSRRTSRGPGMDE